MTELLPFSDDSAVDTKVAFPYHSFRLERNDISQIASFAEPHFSTGKMLLGDLLRELFATDHHLPSYLFPWCLQAALHSIADKFFVPTLPFTFKI